MKWWATFFILLLWGSHNATKCSVRSMTATKFDGTISTSLTTIRYLCSGSVVFTAYYSESGHPGSNPEWGLIYYEAPITAQGLPEPSSLRSSTFGTRAAEHKGCNWGMLIDWWLQPCAVFGHSFSGINWHMPQKWSQFNCMTLSKGSAKR